MAVQRYPVRDEQGEFVERWWWPINVPVLSADGNVSLIIHQVEEVTELVFLRGEAEVRDKLVREQQALIDRLQAVEGRLRQREQHLRIMIDELNHRVKNALAIVQSIVSQTLRSLGLKEASEAVERRLITLAAAHDVITTENWSGADLRAIIDLAGQPYFREDRPRFEIDGPYLKVPPQTAIALALIFHELATNAVKYGALSVDDGRVRVQWTIAQQSTRAVLQLEWREFGGPPVTVPTRRGFGTRLIERSAAGMGAEAKLQFQPDGLVYTLRYELTPDMPNANALRAP
jgi:two-component sensor histidine kinase